MLHFLVPVFLLFFFKSYPDIPCVAQNLSVTFEDSEIDNIIGSAQSLGEVRMLGSLQIVELVEQTGGILVQWDEVSHTSLLTPKMISL